MLTADWHIGGLFLLCVYMVCMVLSVSVTDKNVFYQEVWAKTSLSVLGWKHFKGACDSLENHDLRFLRCWFSSQPLDTRVTRCLSACQSLLWCQEDIIIFKITLAQTKLPSLWLHPDILYMKTTNHKKWRHDTPLTESDTNKQLIHRLNHTK